MTEPRTGRENYGPPTPPATVQHCNGRPDLPALLAQLRRLKGRVALRHGQVVVQAAVPLPDALLKELRTHRTELLQHLQHIASSPLAQAVQRELGAWAEAPRQEPSETQITTCRWCGARDWRSDASGIRCEGCGIWIARSCVVCGSELSVVAVSSRCGYCLRADRE